MRTLHLTRDAGPGGLSRYLLDLCRAGRAGGDEVAVLGGGGPMLEAFEAAGVPYHVVPLDAGPAGFVRAVLAARRFAADFRPDLIHAHHRRAVLLGRRLQTRGRPPLLYTLHLSHMPVGGWRRLVADWGDHAHCASRAAADWLIGLGVPAGRVTTIPHGVDLARYRPPTADERGAARRRFGVGGPAPVAAYVGRLEDPKNVHWLLDVPGRLLVAGDGPDRPALAGHGRITLLGEVDPLAVYHATDLLLLPSAREGFGLAAAEAPACGVPVLRTRTSGAAETVVEGVTGRTTPVDRRAFADAAAGMLSDPAGLAALRGPAAAHARRHLDAARRLGEVLALQRRVAGPWA